MANLIPEEPREFSDPENFETQVAEYIRLKASMKLMETRTKELNKIIMQKIDEQGYEDGEGNWIIDLENPIDGFARLEKQRRASRKIDETVAEAITSAAGIEDEVYEMVKTLSEEKLMAAYYDGKVTEQQLDEMFPVTVQWALWTKK
jgi:phosphoribosylaminoimidazole carboxylase (NCAIR synthetase)